MASALESLCGQAYDAKQYHMLGIYLQRSWVVLLIGSVLLLPLFIFATPVLKLTGQPKNVAELAGTVAELAGTVATWLIPMHMSFVYQFSLVRFLQCQLKTAVIGWVSGLALAFHLFVNWYFVYKYKMGVVGAAIVLDVSWLESFYYSVMVIEAGSLGNTEIDIDALSICVRVANKLGAGNAKGAIFATKISLLTSIIIGLFFCAIILAFPDKLAMIFTSNDTVISMVNELSVLLSLTVLFSCIQPVFTGVALGCGWQSQVAIVNLGSYCVVSVPLGVVLESTTIADETETTTSTFFDEAVLTLLGKECKEVVKKGYQNENDIPKPLLEAIGQALLLQLQFQVTPSPGSSRFTITRVFALRQQHLLPETTPPPTTLAREKDSIPETGTSSTAKRRLFQIEVNFFY
ncbi:hypothetical protein L1987_07793 [Smallanthus sonchifolius]|uniref:Uncharacterized protein n=1 Tax=Smallanthus sonchifolius TaxID=185202 RepID=A0ACB9JJ91_9ASTR|nr:hypothetical protein L1987_07793 [Smallanthus sonchifolius]